MKTIRALALSGCLACLQACAGLTQMQDTTAKFDQGVHTATAAEMTLFRQVRAAECARNFYNSAFTFATASPDRKGAYPADQSDLDLSAGQCVPQELTDDELAIRQKLMDTITLYADSIQALTNGTSDSALSKESQTLAENIKAFGAQQKFSPRGTQSAAALNAAVVTLTTLIVDHSSYKHVKDAARAAQDHLAIVVDELKAENAADAKGLASKADGLTNQMRAAVSAARDRYGPASFLNIVDARVTLRALVVTPPDVAQLNSTLDAIVKANAALARSPNGGAMPEITDLIARGQQASALFNTAK